MLATVHSATLLGVDGRPVVVEVHVSNGLPGYHVVGLPDAAGRESRERVRAALLSSGLTFPVRRITVNLAPATVRKVGAGLELAIALGLLVAGGDLPAECLQGVGLLGELGLDGAVRPVPGTLALVDALARVGVRTVVVAASNAGEAGLVDGVTVRAGRTLAELRECLTGVRPWPEAASPPEPDANGAAPDGAEADEVDLSEVRGLATARLALEVAAAGGHHLLLAGPPGAGKTMLARRLPTVLPPLRRDEALEVTRIHSAAGRVDSGQLVTRPPVRAPHHTATVAALVGGGSGRVQPGELTLAHRGLLFLDELGEFPPRALDALRQPLEDRAVRLARQGVSLTLPADVLLVACTNPCPCGLGPPACRCGDGERARYRRRLSAPLLDRFDLRLLVRAPEPDAPSGEPSATVRARIECAVERQRARLACTPWRRNSHVPAGALSRLTSLTGEADEAWRDAARAGMLTGRGAARVRRVARTLADLAGRAEITAPDVACAAALRQDVV